MANEYTSGKVLSQFRSSKLSDWRQDIIRIKGGVNEVSFLDTTPNIFIVQNTTNHNITISTNGLPTANNYEFKVNGNSTKPIGTPIPKNQIYIYSETSTPFNIRIYSTSMPIDLGIFNDTNIKLDGAEIRTDGIVRGFAPDVSLPTGSNKIGKVEIDGVTSVDLTALTSQLNNLMNSTAVSGKINLYTLNELISGIQTAVTTINNATDSIKTNIAKLSADNSFTDIKEYSGTGVSTLTAINFSTEDIQPNYINHFTNDGTNDITFKIFDSQLNGRGITVKAGETISNIAINLAYVSIAPNGSNPISWRLVVAKRGV